MFRYCEEPFPQLFHICDLKLKGWHFEDLPTTVRQEEDRFKWRYGRNLHVGGTAVSRAFLGATFTRIHAVDARNSQKRDGKRLLVDTVRNSVTQVQEGVGC